MEADWSVEIGPDLPCIDVLWEGFIDLRTRLTDIRAVQETQHFALHEALLALNSKSSPLLTSKCDVWSLASDEIDADEFDTNSENARVGFAAYIDILERDPACFASFAFHEKFCVELVSQLRRCALRQCRVECVLRAARLNEKHGYGVTLYAAGSGVDEDGAYTAWQSSLSAAVAATIAIATHAPHSGE